MYRYDPVSSTEKFFNDIPDDMLRYERNSKVPLDIRDAVRCLDIGSCKLKEGSVKRATKKTVRGSAGREGRTLSFSGANSLLRELHILALILALKWKTRT